MLRKITLVATVAAALLLPVPAFAGHGHGGWHGGHGWRGGHWGGHHGWGGWGGGWGGWGRGGGGGPRNNINIRRRYPYYGYGYYPYYRYGYYRPITATIAPTTIVATTRTIADTVTTAVGTMRDITGSAVV